MSRNNDYDEGYYYANSLFDRYSDATLRYLSRVGNNPLDHSIFNVKHKHTLYYVRKIRMLHRRKWNNYVKDHFIKFE